MKRPGIVWVFTILITLGLLFELFGFFVIFSGAAGIAMSGIIIASLIVELILMILRGIMIFHFFTLKKSAIMWAHISFGAALGYNIINYIIYFATIGPLGTALVAPPSLLVVGLYIFFWWAVVDYVKKKQLDGQPVFT